MAGLWVKLCENICSYHKIDLFAYIEMIATLLLRIINILIGILKSNYLCSTNVHVGSFHQFAN